MEMEVPATEKGGGERGLEYRLKGRARCYKRKGKKIIPKHKPDIAWHLEEMVSAKRGMLDRGKEKRGQQNGNLRVLCVGKGVAPVGSHTPRIERKEAGGHRNLDY